MKINARTIFCAVLISFFPALGRGQVAAGPEAPLARGLGRHGARLKTLLVSVNSDGSDSGNNLSNLFGTFPVISADGRFVAFESNASDLVAHDANGTFDVFVRDLKTGTTILVSVNSDGTGSGNGLSDWPVISADGRFVAFESNASDLVPNDTNGHEDVFVRDLKTGTTTLVSVNSSGTDGGDALSTSPAISADGRVVAFNSEATDLVANDTNGTLDVFARDLKTGTTTLVSVNSDGTSSGNLYSLLPVISADGRVVAFESLASDLVANDTNGTFDLFARDLKTGTTTLVSVNRAGTDSSNGFFTGFPVISNNGRFVAFESDASDLVDNDTNRENDVFVRDLKTGTTTLVSVNGAGTDSGNGRSFVSGISGDGRFVAFDSHAGDLVDNDTNDDIFFGSFMDVFVRDLRTGTTTLVSVNSAGTESGNFGSGASAISSDGRYVVFASRATDLANYDTNGLVLDVFARDLWTGTTTLVSGNSAGTGSGNDESGLFFPAISADGRVVAFESLASDLVANDTNGAVDVFVRSLRK